MADVSTPFIRTTKANVMFDKPFRAKQIAFQANASATTSGSVPYVAIIYPNVDLNVGNCYNSANGRFTCDRAGFYFFSVNTISLNTNLAYCSFYVNGVSFYTEAFFNLATHHVLMFSIMNIQLGVGDYVDNRIGGSAGYGLYGGSYHVFNGCLVC